MVVNEILKPTFVSWTSVSAYVMVFFNSKIKHTTVEKIFFMIQTKLRLKRLRKVFDDN